MFWKVIEDPDYNEDGQLEQEDSFEEQYQDELEEALA